MFDPYTAALEAAEFLKACQSAPSVAVILGSGLGDFSDSLQDSEEIFYPEIPHFPQVQVAGHAGLLKLGRLSKGPRVAALSGRIHLYEGHSIAQVVHAARSLKLWGVKHLLITNAAGGISSQLSPGDLMLIEDHLNLSGQNPLCGPPEERLGPRFPDMTQAYDPEMGALIQAAAEEQGLSLKRGIYAGLQGPSYETPAEIRMLRILGADAVGMSTVSEVIAAHHMGMKVAGLSCITNIAAGLSDQKLSHDEVKETAQGVREVFVRLLHESLFRISEAL